MLINFNPDFSFFKKIFTPKAWSKIGGVIGVCAIIIPATLFISNIVTRAKIAESLAKKSTSSDSIIIDKVDKLAETFFNRLNKLDDSVSNISKDTKNLTYQMKNFKVSYTSHLENELLLFKDFKNNQKVIEDILHQINTLNYIDFTIKSDSTRLVDAGKNINYGNN